MAKIRASKEGQEKFKQARNKKGWNQDDYDLLTKGRVSKSTVQALEQGRNIQQENFVALFKAVGIDDWEAQVDNNLLPQTKAMPEFSQYDSFWVGGEEGREKLVKQLSDRLRGSCRLLLILGLTGIGKTALAERLAVELQDWLQEDWKNRWRIANFDKEKATDFVSVAKNWLYEWYGEGSPEDNKPERLFDKLVKHLRENQVLVLIDSLENLLKENQEEAGVILSISGGKNSF